MLKNQGPKTCGYYGWSLDYKCYCKEDFEDLDPLIEHMRSHFIEGRQRCHFCPMFYTEIDPLIEHVLLAHLRIGFHRCLTCRKLFSELDKCMEHEENCKDPCECPKCGKLLPNEKSVKKHLERKHQGPKIVTI